MELYLRSFFLFLEEKSEYEISDFLSVDGWKTLFLNFLAKGFKTSGSSASTFNFLFIVFDGFKDL